MKKVSIILIITVVLVILCFSIYYVNSTSDKNKVISEAENILNVDLAKMYTFIRDSYENIADIPNQTKLMMAYWYLKDDENSLNIEDYTSDEIQKFFNDIFGSDYTIEFEDIHVREDKSNDILYKYDGTTKKYKYFGNGYGLDETIHPAKIELVEYREENGSFILSYRQLFYVLNDSCDNIVELVDIKRNKLLEVSTEECSGKIVVDLNDDEYENIEAKISIVDYIFEYEDDKLILSGYKIN